MNQDSRSRNLKLSFYDGIFASSMIGFIQDYLTPFLLVIGGSVKHVGMLSAFPNLFASIVQLKSADFTESLKSRKKVINLFVFLQALMLIPMVLMAVFDKINIGTFLTMVVLFTAFGAFAAPAWGSMMSDIVEESRRGQYFGWRTRVLGFVTVGATFIAGVILQVMKKNHIFYGFAIIFGLAFVFRMISWVFLKRMDDPHFDHSKDNYFSLFDFLAQAGKSNFTKFVLFVSLMSFSVNLAAPFFTVLMVKELHFSYLLYTGITITATLTIYLTIRRWGQHADKTGNLAVIRFTAPLIGVIPLFWLFSQRPLFLFFAQVFSGFLWAGFNLCTSNFIYDAVSPQKRVRCIAYFNLLNGLAICLGALSGGFLLPWLPPLFGYKILTLLLVSSILRISVSVVISNRLKETRPVEKVNSYQLFFSMIGIKPILGIDDRKIIRY